MQRISLFTIIFFVIVGSFFYSFRINETQRFFYDTARDTTKVLTLWQRKEITLIGAPLSFAQNTIREVYFGSLYLYVAMIGLIITNWDPVGAALPNIILFLISIPVFYFFAKQVFNSQTEAFLATLIYTVSPITVAHARFFWNPNLTLPISVFFWSLLIYPIKKKFLVIKFLILGFLTGIILNFHYLISLPLLIFLPLLFFKKEFKKTGGFVVGLIIGISPLLVFEIRNNFYLLNAVFYNIEHGTNIKGIDLLNWTGNFFDIFWYLLGIKAIENYYQTFTLPIVALTLLSLLMSINLLFRVKEMEAINIKEFFWIPLVIGILSALYVSGGDNIQYRQLFAVYPLLIILVVKVFFRSNLKLFFILCLGLMVYQSLNIINFSPNYNRNFLPISKIEEISKWIIDDNPQGAYNITENVSGDARAVSFRYFVMRDAKVKPQNELNYKDLETLYVISPSFEKIYEENRWEFYASGSKKLINTADFGEVKVFKFQ